MRPFVFASALLAFARGAPTAREPLFGQSGVPLGDTCTQNYCHCTCDSKYNYQFDTALCLPQEEVDKLIVQVGNSLVFGAKAKGLPPHFNMGFENAGQACATATPAATTPCEFFEKLVATGEAEFISGSDKGPIVTVNCYPPKLN